MIYFIQAEEGGPIKIGYVTEASGVKRRLSQIQTGSSDKLVVRAVQDGGPAREKELHQRFAEWRIKGEWFRPAYEICELCGGLGREVEEAYKRGHSEGYRMGHEQGVEDGRADTDAIVERNREMQRMNQTMGKALATAERQAAAMILALTTEEQRLEWYEHADPRDILSLRAMGQGERHAIMAALFRQPHNPELV